jgi:hypothetical protein
MPARRFPRPHRVNVFHFERQAVSGFLAGGLGFRCGHTSRCERNSKDEARRMGDKAKPPVTYRRRLCYESANHNSAASRRRGLSRNWTLALLSATVTSTINRQLLRRCQPIQAWRTYQ